MYSKNGISWIAASANPSARPPTKSAAKAGQEARSARSPLKKTR